MARTAQRESGARRGTDPRRVLLFDLGGRPYAIRAAMLDGLADCGPVRRVPGAPPAVVGMAEWRGSVITVLDLSRLLGHPPGDAAPCLVRLTPPMHRAALLLRANLRLAEVDREIRPLGQEDGPSPSPSIEGEFEHEGRRVRLIDPQRLLHRVDRRLRKRA
jgi:purine-binding chemotaxis protein CheW